MFKRLISSLVCITFIFSSLQSVHAQDFSVNQLPVPGTMVGPSAPYIPLALKGLIVNPKKPLEFQFIVDTGHGPRDIASVKEQANQLVKYFLAGLTIPEGDLWVNLSPYEKDRIVPAALGQTELGRDLLAQDYILKQLTASLIYPEKDLGREFWSRVYKQAQEQFGTTNVPVNTFNKVWILPDQVQVFENGNAVYVTKATLKVMLDEDYLAMKKHTSVRSDTGSIGANIVRAIILPEITKEVNTGRNFAPVRQIYQALILAKWYKESIQNRLLDAVYTNKSMISGVNLRNPAVKEQIYQRYIQAYKKGAFDYIRESPTPDGQILPRKYFSGGVLPMPKVIGRDGDAAMIHADGQLLALTVDIFHNIGSILAVGAAVTVVGVGAVVGGGTTYLRKKYLKDIESDSVSKRILAYTYLRGFDWNGSFVRRYIRRVKTTHLERKVDLFFVLQSLEKLLQPKRGLSQEYLDFFIRMAQDHSPDISGKAIEALVVTIKLGKVELKDIPASLHDTVILTSSKNEGVNLEKSLIEYSKQRIKDLYSFNDALAKNEQIVDKYGEWLLYKIGEEVERNNRNSDDLNSVTLEDLFYTVGEYMLNRSTDKIVTRILELLRESKIREDQEQLRGAAARALAHKGRPDVIKALIDLLRVSVDGLVNNDTTGKIETIKECVTSLSTISRPEFKQAWDQVFPDQEIVLTSEKVKKLKDLMNSVINKGNVPSGNGSRAVTTNSAMKAEEYNPGGIDLNQININSTGKKINVQFDPAQFNELMQGKFEGFTPVIINIRPISSPLPLLGVSLESQDNSVKA